MHRQESGVIEYFVRDNQRQDLARSAVVFPLFAGMALVIALFVYIPYSSHLPATAPGWIRGMPFWIWMTWTVAEWRKLVALVRAQPTRCNQTGIFHQVQIVFVGGVVVEMFVVGSGDKTHPGFSAELFEVCFVCAEVAVLLFVLTYLLLALFTWTRISWHALLSLAIVCGSLAFTVWFNRLPAGR